MLNTKYMSDYESTMMDAIRDLNTLRTEVRQAEKFIDFARESIDILQDKIFEIEEKYGK